MDRGTLQVPETGQQLRTATCPLRVPGAPCEIIVHADERDEITASILAGTWDVPYHYGLLRALGADGGRVLDLGGHVGTFALYAAALGCEVLAVEASPRNAALLRASAAHNGFTGLRVAGTAVGDTAGEVRFLQAGPYGFVAGAGVAAPTITVPVTTVDRLLGDAGWPTVGLVKMDIEGSEVAALRGMPRLLARPDAPPFVFESNGHTLHLLGETPAAVRERFAAAGYRTFLLRPGRLVPVGPSELQPECNVDYLATRGDADALAGWLVAPPLTMAERLSAVVASCTHTNAHMRAYIARALETADDVLLSDARVRRSLGALLDDGTPDVRAAAAWWAARA